MNYTQEENKVLKIVSKHIDLTVSPFNSENRSVVKIDKRDPMYDGNGIVYLLQMFNDGELINNRIGAYMVFLNSGDEAGFHSHGAKEEQEIYVVMHGTGEYSEKSSENSEVKKTKIIKGNITTVSESGFHSVKSISDEPLIIFVMTTYSPLRQALQ